MPRKTKNVKKTWIIASIICFSLSGCITTPSKEWLMPSPPQTKPVYFQQVEDGYFLGKNEAKKLADNTDELKAYIEKMEILVKEMKKHYGAR